MIHINEYRLGNWVEYNLNHPDFDEDTKPEKHIIRVISDERGVILDDGTEQWYGPKELNPVDLNIEILNKFGFERTQNKYFFLHSSWYNISLKEVGNSYRLYYQLNELVSSEICYVHQLQNLFQVFVNEELKANLSDDKIL